MFSCLWFRYRRAVSSTVRWRHWSLFTTLCLSHSNTAPSLWRAAGCCMVQRRSGKHTRKHTNTHCWAYHCTHPQNLSSIYITHTHIHTQLGLSLPTYLLLFYLQNNRTFQHPLLYDGLQMCVCRVPDIDPGEHLRVPMHFRPYRAGLRKLVAYFDCSAFRDIKASCTLNIKPQQGPRWCGVPDNPLWVTPTHPYNMQQWLTTAHIFLSMLVSHIIYHAISYLTK